MYLLVAVLLGAVTVPLAGGRLARIPDAGVRLALAPPAALAMQALIAVVHTVPTALLRAGHVASFAVAASFVVANRHIRGVPLLGAGGTLNVVAIPANGGVMPASASAVAQAGLAHQPGRFHNSAILAEPRLHVLGDVFGVPASWPLSNVYSLGDILLAAAGITIIHALAGSPWTRRPRRWRRVGSSACCGSHSSAKAAPGSR